MGEINCLGDSLTGAFVVHLRHLRTNIAFISKTEEKTIKIIQNKATFPFILTLWAYGCTEFISAIAFLFKQFSLWPVIISSVIRKNSFMNSWKPTDYGKVSLLNSCYNLFIQSLPITYKQMEAEHESIDLICPSFCHSLWTLGCLKWYNESKNKYFCLIFFLSFDINSYRSGHDHETPNVGYLLSRTIICDRHQFFNVFLICLKKHYSLLEGNW